MNLPSLFDTSGMVSLNFLLLNFVGYLIIKPFLKKIALVWFYGIFRRYTQLNNPIVLFLTIQFSISQQSIAMYR